MTQRQYFILQDTGKTSTNLKALDRVCEYTNGQDIFYFDNSSNSFKKVDVESELYLSEPIGSTNEVTGSNKPTDDIHKTMTANKPMPKLRLNRD